MPLTAILDRQHVGKSATSTDLGAGSLGLQEALLTPQYLWSAELALRAADVNVVPVSDGLYPDRHKRANAYARAAPGVQCAYVAAHVNAGTGDYGAVFHDARSHSGRDLAEAIAAELEARCPELAGVKVVAARPHGWTRNALATIEGIYAGPANVAGVCFEPGFLDQPDHATLWTPEGLRRVGQALSAGVVSWGG